MVDWDNRGRAQTITIQDANTNATLDIRNVSSFYTGEYLVWSISGSVNITVSNIAGVNAVISALFVNY